MGALGFEPRTSALSGRRSNQLSYAPVAARGPCPKRVLHSTTLRASFQALLITGCALAFPLSTQNGNSLYLAARQVGQDAFPSAPPADWLGPGSAARHPSRPIAHWYQNRGATGGCRIHQRWAAPSKPVRRPDKVGSDGPMRTCTQSGGAWVAVSTPKTDRTHPAR